MAYEGKRGAWWDTEQAKNHLQNCLARNQCALKYAWIRRAGTVTCSLQSTGNSMIDGLLGGIVTHGGNRWDANVDFVKLACAILDGRGLLRGPVPTDPIALRCLQDSDRVKKAKGAKRGFGSSNASNSSRNSGHAHNSQLKTVLKSFRHAASYGDSASGSNLMTQAIWNRTLTDEQLYLGLEALLRGAHVPLPRPVEEILEAMANLPRGVTTSSGRGYVGGGHAIPGTQVTTRIPHKKCFELISLIPQRVDANEGARLGTMLIKAAEFPDDIYPNARVYAMDQCRMLMLEHLEEAASYRERMIKSDLASRVRFGSAIDGLRWMQRSSLHQRKGCGSATVFQVPRHVNLRSMNESGNFGTGDAVVFCPMSEYPPSSFCEADVKIAYDGMLCVIFRCKAQWNYLLSKYGKHSEFRCDMMGNRVVHVRQITALEIITQGRNSALTADKAKNKQKRLPNQTLVRAVLTPVKKVDPKLEPILASSAHSTMTGNIAALGLRAQKLNPSQERAARRGLLSHLALIQGPPGTGKTHVSCTIMQQWTTMRTKVLAVAGTNIAVDNLVEGLAKRGVDVLRLGRPDHIRPELLKYSAESIDTDDVKGDKSASYLIVQRRMREASVICTTCAGAGSDRLMSLAFDAVLCDEATQIKECETLMAICRGASQLVLVGDQCQLPPTVHSDQAEREGLSTPFFTRLIGNGIQPIMLDTQYRMHPSIAEFPNDMVYGGCLRNGITDADRPVNLEFPWPNPKVPVALFPTSGYEERQDKSYCNRAEADKVVWAIKALLRAGFSPREIGVVTGYAAQVRLLRRRVRSSLGSKIQNLEISSVDGFQGREKEAIIISTVRSNSVGNVGFLKDWRRVNVMLTRAKSALVVCGNVNTLKSEPTTWAHWIKWASTEGIIDGERSGLRGAYDKKHVRSLGIQRLNREAANMGSALHAVEKMNAQLNNGSSTVPMLPPSQQLKTIVGTAQPSVEPRWSGGATGGVIAIGNNTDVEIRPDASFAELVGNTTIQSARVSGKIGQSQGVSGIKNVGEDGPKQPSLRRHGFSSDSRSPSYSHDRRKKNYGFGRNYRNRRRDRRSRDRCHSLCPINHVMGKPLTQACTDLKINILARSLFVISRSRGRRRERSRERHRRYSKSRSRSRGRRRRYRGDSR